MNIPIIKLNRDRQVLTVDLDDLPTGLSLAECNRLLPTGMHQLEETGTLIIVLYRTAANESTTGDYYRDDNYHYTAGYYSA